MALNFLKRKRASRENALLYHNPKANKQSAYGFAGRKTIKEDADFPFPLFPKILPRETMKEEIAFNNLVDLNVKPAQTSEVEDYHDENNIHERNWDKGKNRIEKLMHEISDLLDSEDLVHGKPNSIADSNSDKKKQEQHSSVPKITSKLSLNLEELHSVAAIAKRLSTRSKIK